MFIIKLLLFYYQRWYNVAARSGAQPNPPQPTPTHPTLEHQPDVRAQPRRVESLDVDAIDRHLAMAHVVKALKQRDRD